MLARDIVQDLIIWHTEGMDIGKSTDTENPAMDTGATGDTMVFVKVREVYDLHTTQNKMTVIGIHTPKPDIIKANFPGLLIQCKAYRPYSCNVKVACASQQALDPQGVGLAEGDVAPEDMFNPILYKACSNFGMSQLEARINYLNQHSGSVNVDVDGQSAVVDVDNLTNLTDEFPIYYGLLSNAHGWRTADPQAGLEMNDLKPLVYEVLYNLGDNGGVADGGAGTLKAPAADGSSIVLGSQSIRGNAKPLPFINCTAYSNEERQVGFQGPTGTVQPTNCMTEVPWINCVVGAIIVPPSRLHELFYRMVVEWTLEFSEIRPIGEITNWTGLSRIASLSHYQNYSFEATKQALGVEGEIMDNSQTMVDANVPVNKVM